MVEEKSLREMAGEGNTEQQTEPDEVQGNDHGRHEQQRASFTGAGAQPPSMFRGPASDLKGAAHRFLRRSPYGPPTVGGSSARGFGQMT